ncbi:MAG: PA14 domain-containing protein [Chthoniobacteraceae bacterium]
MNMIRRSFPALITGLLASTAFAADVETITIRTLRAQMRYDTTEFDVKPGQKVKIVFENDDDMPHNVCFFQAGTDVIAAANKQMDKPEEALKRNWIPDDPRMWAHSKPVNPKESDEINFTAPQKPGVYPYVCTFPGHAAIMNGKMTVGEVGKRGPGLTGLKFQLFLGNWKTLPDFSKLKAHREGDVPDNLVQIKVDDYKNEFGLVFTGKLDAPKDGEYFFHLASDDGGRIAIDGKEVVENDGIHPVNPIREGKVKLKKGTHEFRLEYFQAAGQAELFASWRGPEFVTTPLSKWIHPDMKAGQKAKKKKTEDTGMPLVVAQEPIIYRNFITGAGNRAIGVGYPGNASIAWSTEAMNLAIAWRGAFIDAARHWNDRGGGHQPPLGFDVFRPAELSPPFAVIANGATWPVLEKGARAEGYSWRGYELDAKRMPTFHYEWQGVKVSERYEVVGDALAGEGKLVRTLKLDGKIPAGALFHVASAPKIAPQGAGFLVEGGSFTAEIKTDSKFLVSADGAKLEGKDITLPARPEIVVTYSWPSLHGPHAHAK